jgi:hypothetical protein
VAADRRRLDNGGELIRIGGSPNSEVRHQFRVVESVCAKPVTVSFEHLIRGAVGEDHGKEGKRVAVPGHADFTDRAADLSEPACRRPNQLVD